MAKYTAFFGPTRLPDSKISCIVFERQAKRIEGAEGLRRALAMVPDIEFYRYEVKFSLKKG
jgi:hypothetical protein